MEKKRKEKENFLRKFFPLCTSSPGGTQRLITRNSTDVASAKGRRVGKMMARRSDILSSKTFNFNITNDSCTDTYNLKKEQKMQTSLGLLGSAHILSSESKSTNHRRERGHGVEDINDG